MKIVVFIIAVIYCLPAKAQDSLRKSLPDTGSTYIIRLIDNTALSGRILGKNAREIIFNDVNIGKVSIPATKIESMRRITGNQYCILTMIDGNTFKGTLLSQNDKEVVLKTENLGTLTIANEKIKSIKIDDKQQIGPGSALFSNPHPTRYFFASSTIPLKKGEGYFQNTMLLLNGVQVGVTDHFTIGGGIIVPLAFYINPKLGYKVAENVHLGAGIWAATTVGVGASNALSLGIGYGAVTLGSKEQNITASLGWGFAKSGPSGGFSDRPAFALSAMTCLSRKIALVTENWAFSTRKATYSQYNNYGNSYNSNATYTYEFNYFLSGGFRIMGESNSFDIALVLPVFGSNNNSFGFPYFNYVFKF
jgi:hypothetical protein